jgi:hypothetical protein
MCGGTTMNHQHKAKMMPKTLYDKLKGNRIATQNWENYGEWQTGKDLKDDEAWIIKDLRYIVDMRYQEGEDTMTDMDAKAKKEWAQIKQVLRQCREAK